jgi:hypothetical protein
MDWKKLLGSITESVDEELRLRNAYLAAENCLFRQQIRGQVHLTNAERKTLAEMGQQLGKQVLEEIATIAKPDTILAWHRKFVDLQDVLPPRHQSVGRPRIDKELEDLVVRMARENRSWGYDRIVGALSNLGYHISGQTVGNILKRHGLPPAPERKKTMTWREFIRPHMAMLLATGFFTHAVWCWLGLVISALLCFLSCCRHHVCEAGMTLHDRMRLMLPCLSWLLDVPTFVERWGRLVTAVARLQLMLFDQGGVRLLRSACTPYAHRICFPQGMGKVVLLPMGHRRQIRDGPLRRQQRLDRLHLDRLHKDTKREAA